MDQTLQPDDQMWIDVGDLIRRQTPDKTGKVLPADLTSGSYEFSDLTNHSFGTLFEGKVIYDKTFGHVSYGCASCCADGPPISFFTDPGEVGVGDPGQIEITGYDSCSGATDDILDGFTSWSSASPSIASVNAATALVTGVAVGTATQSSPGTYLYGGADIKHCRMMPATPGGPANVVVTLQQSGKDITNATQSAVTGQQIALSANYTLQSGVSVSSQSWSVPGTTTGGYNPSPTSGSTVATNFSSQSNTFYWLDAANSRQITFTLKTSDGGTYTAVTTFNVSGPSGISVTVSGQGFGISPDQTEMAWGIKFVSAATTPTGYPGSFSWVQLVQSYQDLSYLIGGKIDTCNAGPGLDTSYPYTTGMSAQDGPSDPLLGQYQVEEKETASFQMFLMWNPGTGTSSIPVPLGSVSWGISGDAKYSGGSWAGTGQTTNGAFSPSAIYPVWNSTVSPDSIASSCN